MGSLNRSGAEELKQCNQSVKISSSVCTTVLTTSTIFYPPKKKKYLCLSYTVLSALQVWWWNDAAADAALGAPYIRKQDATTSANVTVTQQQQHHPPSASRGLKPATTPFCPLFQSIHGVMVVSKKKNAMPTRATCYTVACAPREASALAQVLFRSILPPARLFSSTGFFCSCLRCCHKRTHNVTVTQQQQHHLPSASRGLKPARTPFHLPFQSIHGVMVVSKKRHANPCNLHCLLRGARGFSGASPSFAQVLLHSIVHPRVSSLQRDFCFLFTGHLFSLRRHRRRPLVYYAALRRLIFGGL
jgi:hypothetical protein